MAITMEAIKVLRETTGAGIMDCKKALTATDGDVDKAADWLRENGITKAAKKASRIAAEGVTSIAVCGDTAAIVEVNSETDFVAKNEKFVSLVDVIAKAVATKKPLTLEAANDTEFEGNTIAQKVIDATATIGEKISFRRFETVTKTAEQSFGSYIHSNKKIGVIVCLDGANKEELARDIAMHIAALGPTYIGIEDVPSDVVEHEKHIQMENAKNDPKLAGKPEAALEKILEGKVRKQLAEVCLLEQDFVKEPGKKVGVVVKEANSRVVTFVRYAVGEGLQKREDNFAEEVMSQIKG